MNPIQLIMMLKNNPNPQQLMINMIQQQMGNNPLFLNLLSLGQQGKNNEIEMIARNMFKEKGLDFDKEFNSFKRNFGL